MFGRVIPEQRGDVRFIIRKFYSQLMWHDVMWHGVLKFLVKASRNSWWKDTGCNLQHTFSDKSSGDPGDLRVASFSLADFGRPSANRPVCWRIVAAGRDVEPRWVEHQSLAGVERVPLRFRKGGESRFFQNLGA